MIVKNHTTLIEFIFMSNHDESYSFREPIDDNGSFATVWEMKGKNSGKSFALKQYRDVYNVSPFVFELECYSLSSDYIIKGKDLLETNNEQSNMKTIGVILDLAEGDGLWLVQMKDISWRMKTMLFTEAIIAVDYLHRCGVLHLDLKPSNFLIFSESEQGKECNKYKLMLIDFSLSAQIPIGMHYKPFDIERTPEAFTAPEFNKKEYNDKHDVWSLGITLLFMSVTATQFKKRYKKSLNENQADRITDKLYKMNQDVDFIDLIKHMLNKDPKRRYSMRDVIKHKFVKKGMKFINYKPQELVSTYGRATISSLNKMKKFNRWCSEHDIESDVTSLTCVILYENNTLLDGIFKNEYSHQFKSVVKKAVALSIAFELIENDEDRTDFVSGLFVGKFSKDEFSNIIKEFKLTFICNKYQGVFEGNDKGMLHLDW